MVEKHRTHGRRSFARETKGFIRPDGTLDFADPACIYEIRRLVTAFYRDASTRAYLRARAASGRRGARIELEDLVQDVCLVLVRRDASSGSRYDPARGGFSKWIWQTCRSVISHATDRRCAEDLTDEGTLTRKAEESAQIGEAPEDGPESYWREVEIAERGPGLAKLAREVERDARTGQGRLFDLGTDAGIRKEVA